MRLVFAGGAAGAGSGRCRVARRRRGGSTDTRRSTSRPEGDLLYSRLQLRPVANIPPNTDLHYTRMQLSFNVLQLNK